MAKLVLGLGASHTPMLNASPEDWLNNFQALDRKRQHRDKDGKPVTYDELVKIADPRAEASLNAGVMQEKHARAQVGLERLKDNLAAAKLDALIIIGDDQNELFGTDNIPAILIYRGAQIPNTPRHLGNPNIPPWYAPAQAGFYNDPAKDYPVDAALATHLISALNGQEFDISSADRIRGEEGEGHAFAFIHRRIMGAQPIPIVPVFLNTYFPPNQPTPKRCYALGQAIRAAVEAYPADIRVGIVASGGLSHFTVDEELDGLVIDALKTKDAAALQALPLNKLEAGSSEIRNWVCIAGALEGLDMQWADYIAGYRSPAGTGTGICFAIWS